MANIWVAASDGNLARVEELLASGLSPNEKDENSYTPMHAAASYGHLAMLDFLIAHGGDINLTDNDGDTPIYTAENVATAQYLVEHGAIVDRVNNDGISPIVHLEEDYPEVAEYLRGLDTSSTGSSTVDAAPPPSQYLQNAASEQLTNNLMASLEEIDPESEVPLDQQIQEKVGRTVIEGVLTGYELSQNPDSDERELSESSSTKKQKMEGNGS